VLHAVHQEESLAGKAPAQLCGESLRALDADGGIHAEGLGDLGDHPRRIRGRGQRREADLVPEVRAQLFRELQGQPRLPGPAGAGQGQQAHVRPPQESAEPLQVGITSDQRRVRHGRRRDAQGRPAPGPGVELAAQRRQLARELTGRAVAIGRALGQAALDEPEQRLRNVGERRRRVALDGGDRLRVRRLVEGPAAGGHLVEHHPQRELVGVEVDGPSLRLLR
jgi:hypothetical protein